MQREIEMVIGSRLQAAEEWIFSDLNNPIQVGPAARLNAKQLASKTSPQLKDILSDVSTLYSNAEIGVLGDPKGSTDLFRVTTGKGYQSIS
jgi:hypothetical protein